MLLCRCCLGRFYHTTVRDIDAGDKVGLGEYDSTFGDREQSANAFREFVVYDAAQIYPEYLVIYTRIYPDDKPRPALVPFQLELPLHWKNVHRDVNHEIFDEHVPVPARTKDMLEELIDEDLGADAEKKEVEVRCAIRVESSKLWLAYQNVKSNA
jgi:hypothetical protein